MSSLEFITDGLILTSAAIAFVGIGINREYIRPKINSTLYDNISLPLEHLVHHTALAASAGIVFKYAGVDIRKIPLLSFTLSILQGVIVEGWHALEYYAKNRPDKAKAQGIQFFFDVIGAGAG